MPIEPPLLPVRVMHSEPALGKVRALVATSDGPLWAGTDSGVIVEFAFEGLELRRFHAHKGGVRSIAIAEGVLVSGGNDGQIATWSIESLACGIRHKAQGKRVHAVGIDRAKRVLWALARNGRRDAWSLNDGRALPSPDEVPIEDLSDEAGAVRMGASCLRAVRGVVQAWTSAGLAWEVVLPGFEHATAIAGSRGLAGETQVAWVAGRGVQRAGLLARVPSADPTRTAAWRLPYSAACLAFWRDEQTLYAGGNGRVFAIDLGSTGAASA